jgi:hypothetical protein
MLSRRRARNGSNERKREKKEALRYRIAPLEITPANFAK